MKLQKVRTRKKKLKNKVIQTGGGWPPGLLKLNTDILDEETNLYFQNVECEKSMTVLLQDDEKETFKEDLNIQYQAALDNFMLKNSRINTGFFLYSNNLKPSGRGRGRGRLTKDVGTKPPLDFKNYRYSLELRMQLHQDVRNSFHTNRRITFLRSHCNYGYYYLKVPPNLAICFLTPLNNYSFNKVKGKLNMFERSKPLADRKRYFNDIYNFHFNYFEEEEIDYDNYQGALAMDYFREATWYYPDQLCPDANLYMSEKEFLERPDIKNFFSVDDTTYEKYYDNKILLDHFDYSKVPKNDNYDMNLSMIIEKGQFKPECSYVVIIDGCRVAEHDPLYNKQANQYNFIHYHLTRYVCKKVFNEYKKEFPKLFPEKPITIDDFHITLRPREILHYHTFDSAVDLVKKDITFNYYSANNPIIRHFLEKLEKCLEGKGPGSREAINLCRKINNYVKKLNYDKILRMSYKVNELFDKPQYDRTLIKNLFEVCFNQGTVEFKQTFLVKTLDNLLGSENFSEEDSTELLPKFNIDIIISMIKRYGNLVSLIDFLQFKGAEIEITKPLPTMFGVEYLNSNIFYKNVGGIKMEYERNEHRKNTFIMNLNHGDLEITISLLEQLVPQNQVVFFQCDFEGKNFNFQRIRAEKILLIKCVRLMKGQNFNPITPELKISDTRDKIGFLKLDYVLKLTICNSTLNAFALKCVNLTYLYLDITPETSFAPVDFILPNLETLILKGNQYVRANSIQRFNIPMAPRLKNIHLENINFSNNTVWDLTRFIILEDLSIINCKLPLPLPEKKYFIVYKKLKRLKLVNVKMNEIRDTLLNLDKSPNIKDLTLDKIIEYQDENGFKTMIEFLKTKYLNGGYISENIFPSLQDLFF